VIRMKGTAAIAAVAVLGLAACGTPSANNKVGSSNTGGNQGPQQKATDESAKGPAKDIAGPRRAAP